MRDLVSYVCHRAAQTFGRNPGVFNAASFSNHFANITGLKETVLDGNAVRAILWGRDDIEHLPGGAFYRYLGDVKEDE